ncbi:MAG: long-chain fatty acid--CoA ligase [Bacteroidales bacterium]|nr:long-chain fatty acid--CoA ligase [Bacteroidales bacterium]
MKEETRLFDILDNYCEKWPDQNVALAKKENGVWVKYSPKQYQEISRNLAYALIELGIQPQDKIAIISSNRPEWNMLDMAIQQIGAIIVPIYPTISKEDYHFILNNCEAKMVILEGIAVMNKIEEILPNTPNLKLIYTMSDRQKYPFFQQLLELGETHHHPEELELRRNNVKTGDCATIIYTSGTTGVPKGVMLSHSNLLGQLRGIQHTPAKWSKTAFSFLPICHAYERVLVYMYQLLGMSVYYAESLATIADNMKEIHPTMMTAVPRVLEKMYEKIVQNGNKMKGLSGYIFRWAVKLTERYKIDPDERSSFYNLKIKIADKLVYSKIREQLGAENFDIIVSGAASISQKVAGFFSAIKMPVYEGYGMTETSPVICVSDNSKGGREVGTVGRALPGIELKINEQGEIICRGHNVMLGYYKNEELTKEIIDKDGWLHTGDMGYIDDRGRLFITGRLKNLFKTSMGKYINPQVIEEKFSESKFIENIVVFGEGQKFAAALIVPNFAYIKTWFAQQNKLNFNLKQNNKQNKLDFTTKEECIKMKEVKDAISKEVKNYNTFFGETEQIKKFELVADDWTIENGIMTPTLKVKRKVVQQRYKNLIDSMFE